MTAPESKRRWFQPTPGKLLVVLLAVEGILILSEWYRWIPKGWPVLIAIGAVGLFLLFLLIWFFVGFFLHRRFQFSIRSLLILPLTIFIPCSWMAVERSWAEDQRRAIMSIYWRASSQKLVWYDYEFAGWYKPLRRTQPPEPAWLRKLVGEGFFREVVALSLNGSDVDNDRLKVLHTLNRVKWLSFCYTNITDDGLKHVAACAQLQGLTLSHSKWITDSGMAHLQGLSELRDVGLNGTQVTDEGIKELQQALPKCSVNGETEDWGTDLRETDSVIGK
jgi:hypothetical protein